MGARQQNSNEAIVNIVKKLETMVENTANEYSYIFYF
jgi:hypothetical protein